MDKHKLNGLAIYFIHPYHVFLIELNLELLFRGPLALVNPCRYIRYLFVCLVEVVIVRVSLWFKK